MKKPPFSNRTPGIPGMQCYSLTDENPRRIGQIFIMACPVNESAMNDLIGLIGSVVWLANLSD
jgi:hypothetical protein